MLDDDGQPFICVTLNGAYSIIMDDQLPNTLQFMSNNSTITLKPARRSRHRVAIVGAGLSGLVAANALAKRGHGVQVFEKSRGPGGRMSTRRVDDYAFDHGAQYFTVRHVRFKQSVAAWAAAGIVKKWNGRIRVLRAGQVSSEKHAHQRYVGVPGMSAVTRHLATGLAIQRQTLVDHITKKGPTIQVLDADGRTLGSFDALVVTVPPEQSVHLLKDLTPLVQQIARVRMNPCWSVMLAFDKSLEVAFDGAFIHGADVTWAARNSSKPQRGGQETWVLHASGKWSRSNLNLGSDQVIQHLLAAFFTSAAIKPEIPVFSTAHRWRYAQAQNPLAAGCLWDAQARIGVCGDWCHRSRIEGAFLSGMAMAEKVISALPHQAIC